MALAPSIFSLPIFLNKDPNLGSSHSTTLPIQKNRMIRGDFAKEQNMIVILLFSYIWLMVSLPEPVASTYAAWLESNILKVEEGRPLGEMLTCLPVKGAEAVKNTCCWSAYWIFRYVLDRLFVYEAQERGTHPFFQILWY